MQFQFLHFRDALAVAVGLLVLLSMPRFVCGQTDSSGTGDEITQAISVLTSDASRQEKVNACRRLAARGGAESIAPLAALLADIDLSHPARMALEAIPDPAAGEALRAALPGLEGGLLIGVMNSLAARRETAAVPDIGRYLTSSEPQVAAAACIALGTIGSPEAIELLENGLSQLAYEVYADWGNACLRGVATLRAQGLDDRALQLCQSMRGVKLPVFLRNAATRQAMLIRPAAADALLQELLASTDESSFSTALTASRELKAPGVTKVLIAVLPALPPARQMFVIQTLGDLADPAARDALVQCAASDDIVMRSAALRALGHTGDATSVPLLLEAAGAAEAEAAAAARQALVSLPGNDIDAAVLSAFADATGSLRLALIDVIGQRQISAATEQLVPMATDPDLPTRLAAVKALGQLIDAPQLRVLIDQLAVPSVPEQREILHQALRNVCRRTTDKSSCAQQLQACLPQVDRETRPIVIGLLSTVGGPAALESLTALAKDPDELLQEAATRELGRWRTPDVAPALIDLARSAPEQKYRIRALRGYLRVIRQMDLPDEEKFAMCRQAMEAAVRSEERLLAVSSLARIPTSDALEAAVGCLTQPDLSETACAAAVTIAERVGSDHSADAAEAMRRVLDVAKDPELRRRAESVLAHMKQ